MQVSSLYDQFISFIDSRDFILGLVIAGSYAKGLQHEDSDLDLYIIVQNNTSTDDINQLKTVINDSVYKELRIDISNNAVQTLNEFTNYAVIGSPYDWDRYNLVHAKTIIDKTNGQLAEILSQKATLPDEEIAHTLRDYLGAYINVSYRAMKYEVRNTAKLLDAGESLQYMLICLFAMDGRVRPYNKYLKWELEHRDLSYFRSQSDLYTLIVDYAQARPHAHKLLFKIIKQQAVALGFSGAYDTWGDKLSVFDNT